MPRPSRPRVRRASSTSKMTGRKAAWGLSAEAAPPPLAAPAAPPMLTSTAVALAPTASQRPAKSVRCVQAQRMAPGLLALALALHPEEDQAMAPQSNQEHCGMGVRAGQATLTALPASSGVQVKLRAPRAAPQGRETWGCTW